MKVLPTLIFCDGTPLGSFVAKKPSLKFTPKTPLSSGHSSLPVNFSLQQSQSCLTIKDWKRSLRVCSYCEFHIFGLSVHLTDFLDFLWCWSFFFTFDVGSKRAKKDQSTTPHKPTSNVGSRLTRLFQSTGQIETNYDEITDSFDAMELKPELLRGMC